MIPNIGKVLLDDWIREANVPSLDVLRFHSSRANNGVEEMRNAVPSSSSWQKTLAY